MQCLILEIGELLAQLLMHAAIQVYDGSDEVIGIGHEISPLLRSPHLSS